MNDRIKAIAVQAGAGEWGDSVIATTMDIEKFAELLAEDVADLCEDIDGGENMFSRAIRKEYGVKQGETE
jgi:hypothetical protein